MSCHYLSYRVPQDPKINKQKNYNMTAGATPGTQPNTRGRPPPRKHSQPRPTHTQHPHQQAPTQPPGTHNRRESRTARHPPAPTPPDPAKTTSTTAKPPRPPPSPDQYQKKKDEILEPHCATHPPTKPGTREMR